MIGPIITILAFVFAGIVIFAVIGLKLVRHAEAVVVERLGRYHRTLQSGLNIIWPIIDRPRPIFWRYVISSIDGSSSQIIQRLTSRLDLREAVYDFPRQSVITRDNVAITINALVYFQVTDPVRSVYEIANLPDAIEKLTQTTLRNVIGELDLDETLTSRDTINKKIGAILDEATDKWGVKVNRVELQDITPPLDVQQAMEKQMRAERDRRAVILQAEGARNAQILQAEGIRDAEINKAEGERQAAVLRAQGQAEALERMALAEANALARVKTSLPEGQTDPASYLIAIRYISTLKEMVSGQDNKTVYVPYEATGLIGALGGIKSMLEKS